jgi:hypothetical protein
MKYAVKMGSCAMTYKTYRVSIMFGSGIEKLIRGEGDSQTHRQHGDLISLLPLLKKRK